MFFKVLIQKIHTHYQDYGFKNTVSKIVEHLLLSTIFKRKVIHKPLHIAINHSLLRLNDKSYFGNSKPKKKNNKNLIFPNRINTSSSAKSKNQKIISFNDIKFFVKSIIAVLKIIQPSKLRYPSLPSYKRKQPTNFPSDTNNFQTYNTLLITDDFHLANQIIQNTLYNLEVSIDIKTLESIRSIKSILNYQFIMVCNLELDNSIINNKLRQCLAYSHINYIPSFYLWEDSKTNDYNTKALESTDYIITCDGNIFEKYKNIILLDKNQSQEQSKDIFTKAIQKYNRRHLPKVSIITILYKKAHEIEPVLKSYLRQSYIGEIEIIFIDDYSPDKDADIVNNFFFQAYKDNPDLDLPKYKIIKNSHNMGNCYSRNQGIKNATGDILIVIDADCMINKDFVENHVAAHSFNDCDISLGFFGIETGNAPPLKILKHFENHPEKASEKCKIQDSINKASFLNCVTRNFCVRREFLDSELFDLQFSYSNHPNSGFGWEDIELGYRLYKKGARIKFINDAFSLHISHQSIVSDGDKPLRSLKNFRRLFEKHPELALVVRRWALETYEKICKWIDKYNLPNNEDRRFLDNLFQKCGSSKSFNYNQSRRKLKILTYPWHIPHQYEIYKLPYEFTLLTDLGSGISRGWNLDKRPMPNNVEFKCINDVKVKDFDLAILHFDENVLAPENTNGVINYSWGKSFRYLKENTDLPKIAICHGTPQFYGQYDMNYKKDNLMQIIEEERKKLVQYLGDILTITNSYQANREWNFKNTKAIWHGFDPSEFPATNYEKGILTPFGTPMISRPYYRGYYIFQEVFNDFPEDFTPGILNVKEPHILYQGNQYAYAKFRNYVDDIRQYSIYFNPTIRSPMPRSRGEAMMCGLVNVSLKNHDVDLFIKNGVNGFYSEDPKELRDILLHLLNNPQEAQKIGKKGREFAMNIFNYDRFLQNWNNTINEII